MNELPHWPPPQDWKPPARRAPSAVLIVLGVAAGLVAWYEAGRPNWDVRVGELLAASAILLGSAFHRNGIAWIVLVALLWFGFAALLAVLFAAV